MAKRARFLPGSIHWCAALLAAALGAPLAQADTIEVPGDAASLSAAIALAQDGDTILVGDGTWKGPANRDLVISGKDLVLRSEHGPAKCTIDCELLGRAVSLVGCGRQTAVQGFTIRRGKVGSGSTPGQGLYISGGAPILRDCVVDGCGFTYHGTLYGPTGGGLVLLSSSALVEDCTFTSNAAEFGGAVAASGGSPTLRRCLFRGNTGEAHIEEGIPVGGFWEGSGGAVYLVSCVQAVVANCVFDSNVSINQSGALYVANGTGRISHCTFVRNNALPGFLAVTEPGEIIEVSGSAAGGLLWQMDHCIVWGNTLSDDPLLAPAKGFTTSSCDIEGGYTGRGNLHVDPHFVNLGAGDVRLAAGSPCIDVGPPGAMPFGGIADLDHGSRLIDGNLDGELALDMGAYERSNVSLKVTGVANPGSTLSLSLDGKAGLPCIVALGVPLAGPATLDAKLGYSLADLGDPWRLVAGPDVLPATTTFVVPANLPPGTTFILQPIAWVRALHAGNFGAPQWIVVP